MKQSEKRKLELLAPAKNLACGIAAIECGADAIYIGAPKFGARSAVGNSIEDIKQLCELAHTYGAKVFVTLNTILYDDELEEAETLIHELYEAKVDALIIQDMGILKMNLPPIAIHASTQTNNFDLERIQFMDKLGVDRIVLARELSLRQIKKAYETVEAELEVFVHGSLCVSLSGQCYMSQSTGGRSANRGSCAYSCRHSYTLMDADNNVLIRDKHLLSLKDMDRSKWLKEMADAGTTSFKIEGRLKDTDYVKNIVSHYRETLDKVIASDDRYEKASAGVVTRSFTPNVQKSFSRGQTDYFLNGRDLNISSKDTPKSLGEQVGTVTRLGKNYFELNMTEPLNNNDGLVFFDAGNRLCGLKVNRVEGRRVYPSKGDLPTNGTTIYRNYDHAFRMGLEKAVVKRQIKLNILVEEVDLGLKITSTDEDNVQAIIQVETAKEPAQNAEKANSVLVQQLSKSGNTPFIVKTVENKLSAPLFFRAAELNQIRRDILDAHLQKRLEHFAPKPQKRKIDLNQKLDKAHLNYSFNVSNQKAREFYTQLGAKEVEPAFELEQPESAVVMTTKYCIRYEMGRCLKYSRPVITPDLKEPLYLHDKRHSFRLNFDCKRCVMEIISEKFEG